jgi:predicted amidohydrolase YtcJ
MAKQAWPGCIVINGAFAAFDEKEAGSLTVGKRADVVVLDRDITAVPPSEISAGKVLVTLIDGQPVYEADTLPKPSGP